MDKVHKLETENTDLACALATAQTAIAALTDECKHVEAQLDTAGIALTGAWSDLDKAVDEIRRLQQQHIGDAITIARLRRELHNTQPRITRVTATAERPMAPESVLPLPYQTVKEVA
ncbi:hypothetical protein [Streptomyces malaysiensis]